ncbi:sulfatase-like hydrolase/transferase [Paenibacillus sacheonensis]|uniref:sulfatase-like hydrolase/transferase n=1 Tax=Paenibacillus sacheonensis TaxID=742054 RepID=UPI00195EF81E|nr:arylsulfatase [Paenibacillus sacheonensis]
MSQRPNVLLILNDDMGYSDIGCYGGEVSTPNLDRLAANGLRFSQFYNTARCSPTRASLLTGLHPHQTGVGILVDDDGPEGYAGNLNQRGVTIAEVLKAQDYHTYMSGKWHVATDIFNPNDTWPRQRGFDRYYGIITGAADYYQPVTLTRDNDNAEHEALADDFYLTDAISDDAVRNIRDHAAANPDQPFFHYVAYTAPHWPLHAPEEDIAKYKGRFDEGWDVLREKRLKRLVEQGLLDPSLALSERDPSQPAWEDADVKEWRLRRMEVYAAQIDRMDQGIGRILQALENTGQLDNTLILFLADNGGCAEELDEPFTSFLKKRRSLLERAKDGSPIVYGNNPRELPGSQRTYQSYGVAWANLSNTPFRLYKHWIHEGGISTPLIAHWPAGIGEQGGIRHSPGQLTDIMATVLEVTGAPYPQTYQGRDILPFEGESLAPLFKAESDDRGRGPLFWEHEGNSAVRTGPWKLVRNYPEAWELYDIEADRTELNDLAADYPDKVRELSGLYEQWAARAGVVPREKILEIYSKARGEDISGGAHFIQK